MSEKQPFAASILACRANEYRHVAVLLVARNADEALGKALQVARKGYEESEGWTHHVMVSLPGVVIDDPHTARMERGMSDLPVHQKERYG